jgi:hypothetical protein
MSANVSVLVRVDEGRQLARWLKRWQPAASTCETLLIVPPSTRPPALPAGMRAVMVSPTTPLGRWSAAREAVGEILVWQSASTHLPAPTIERLAQAATLEPNRLAGLEGRRLVAPLTTSNPLLELDVFGDVPLLLGEGLALHRQWLDDFLTESSHVHAAMLASDSAARRQLATGGFPFEEVVLSLWLTRTTGQTHRASFAQHSKLDADDGDNRRLSLCPRLLARLMKHYGAKATPLRCWWPVAGRAKRSRPRRLLQVCPSLGKACGVANFAENFAAGLERRGWSVETEREPVATTADIVLIQHEFGLFDRAEVEALCRRYTQPKLLFAHSPGAELFAPLVDGFLALSPGVVAADKPTCLMPHPSWVAPQVLDRRELKRSLGWHRHRAVVGSCGFMSPERGFDRVVDRLLAFAHGHDVHIALFCSRHATHEQRPAHLAVERKLRNLAARHSRALSIVTDFLPQTELNARLQACDLLWCWTGTPQRPYGSGTASDMYGAGTRLVVSAKTQHSQLFGLPNVVIASADIEAFVTTLRRELLARDFPRHDPSVLAWDKLSQLPADFIERAIKAQAASRPRAHSPSAERSG